MNEPVKICIVLEGGIISQVLSAGVSVMATIVDYDVDADPESPDVVQVPQQSGETSPAWLTQWDACTESADRKFVQWAFDAIAARGES